LDRGRRRGRPRSRAARAGDGPFADRAAPLRPLVGITPDSTLARFGAGEEVSALVPWDYVRAIEHAGGRPLLVPPSDDGLEETLDALDGLILSGGSDLDPERYGQEAHPET